MMTPSESTLLTLVPQLVDLIDRPEIALDDLAAEADFLVDLRTVLVDDIEHLLVHQKELLLSVLYRIDVEESLVIDALGLSDRRAIAERLATLVLDRQIMKVRSRRKYRNQSA